MIIDVHSHLHTEGVEDLLGERLVKDLNYFVRFDTDE